MNKSDYRRARRIYRDALGQDRKWQPNPYAARNNPQVPANSAARILERLPPAIRPILAANRPLPATGNWRLPPGPRALWYRNWEPTGGKFNRMNLSKRVALRGALLKMAENELSRRPFAPIDHLPLLRATDKLDAGTLRLRADNARRAYYLEQSL